MKMVERIILPIILSIIMVGCTVNETTNTTVEPTNKETQNDGVVNEMSSLNINTAKEVKEKGDLNTIKAEINNKELIVELEDNQATKELIKKLNEGNVIVEAQEYGGFEKVGSLGFSLTRDDKQIKTEAGDIVLYQGNQISLFYNSNSWSYTKLGKVTNVSASELKDLLGTGDVTITLKK